jgi:SAM-dependent methyltransferase
VVQSTSFLDLGTGNGHFLFALRAAGWTGQMLGIDYSAASIRLARQIEWRRAQERPDTEAVESSTPILFEEHDILSRTLPSHMNRGGFDVVLDKGTFDAVSLSSERDAAGHRICETYCSSVEPLVRDGGLFIITSCNWTETELLVWFGIRDVSEAGPFKLKDRIKYPKFTFGGQTGQSVVTLCFEKKKEYPTHQ